MEQEVFERAASALLSSVTWDKLNFGYVLFHPGWHVLVLSIRCVVRGPLVYQHTHGRVPKKNLYQPFALANDHREVSIAAGLIE